MIATCATWTELHPDRRGRGLRHGPSATTYGCLTAIDKLTRGRTFGRVLDLGCGSGVLAISVARALPRARIIATDLDKQSVKVAAGNMGVNGSAGASVRSRRLAWTIRC